MRRIVRIGGCKVIKLEHFGSRLAIAMVILGACHAHSQTVATRPEFEVASVRPNPACDKVKGAGAQDPSPGRVRFECLSLNDLIKFAYGHFANGTSFNPLDSPIVGISRAMESDRYDVMAKAADAAHFEKMAGPMLQSLLEERFKLKVHRETRQAPVYFLRADKRGLKLQPMKEGTCVDLDLDHLPSKPAPGRFPTFCGYPAVRRHGNNVRMDAKGMTTAQFCRFLSGSVGRNIIDETGFSGRFDFRLEYAPDETMPGFTSIGPPPGVLPIAPAPSLFTVLSEQMGLKLVAGKGPVEFLVVDHVERPTEN